MQPTYVTGYYNLAIILGELNHISEAKKYFEKGLNLDPNNKKICNGYGKILLKLNQHIKGLEYIRKGSGLIRFTNTNFKII